MRLLTLVVTLAVLLASTPAKAKMVNILFLGEVTQTKERIIREAFALTEQKAGISLGAARVLPFEPRSKELVDVLYEVLIESSKAEDWDLAIAFVDLPGYGFRDLNSRRLIVLGRQASVKVLIHELGHAFGVDHFTFDFWGKMKKWTGQN